MQVISGVMNLEQQNSPGTQHASHLINGASVVHVRQSETAVHDVKAAGRKRQRLAFAVDESDSGRWRVRGIEVSTHATGLRCRIDSNAKCSLKDNKGVKCLPDSTTHVENALDSEIRDHFEKRLKAARLVH